MNKDAVVQSTLFVTLVKLTDKNSKSFTMELFSRTAEEAYLKEKTVNSLVKVKEDIEKAELIGTYRRVELKVIGDFI